MRPKLHTARRIMTAVGVAALFLAGLTGCESNCATGTTTQVNCI